jgi:RimJ/RimL family protein N-acetyltransferase
MLVNAASSTPVLRISTFARNERAKRFFENRGFRAVGTGDGSANEEHEPDLRYERSTRDPL